ncbi:MAG: hypothetical protein B6D41_00425 [Chloroflexi bacterium UTCFX4]|nr:MAG: hypothetical protein B6D41_00425 [Chloroflexi bacterium UTCFX4]
MKRINKIFFEGGNPRGPRWLVILAACLLAAGALARTLMVAGEVGLPVDDAWIFQVFARNLAWRGEIAFNPGYPATGATSLLWLMLLAPAYWLPLAPLLWTYALSLFFYIGVGWMVLELGRVYFVGENKMRWALVAALLTLCEWHMLWAALAGMETLGFTFLSLLLVYLSMRRGAAWQLGIVGGLLTFMRVEGILLFGLIWLWNFRRFECRARAAMLVAFALPLAPLLWVNWSVGGSLLPVTWSSKILSVHQPQSGLNFLFEYAMMLLIGINLLWVPALLFLLYAPRAKKIFFSLPLLWVLALLLAYAVTFPVIFNQLRYMMPTLPWFILLGVAGTARLFQNNRAVGWLQLGTSALFGVALALFGMNVFAWNVQNINAQHILVGKWLRQNTPASARVAVADIGAMGYFSERYMLDLQGLATPEILPLLRAGVPLAPFVCAQQTQYMALFPETYTDVLRALGAVEIFNAHLDFVTITPAADLTVYQVDCAN